MILKDLSPDPKLSLHKKKNCGQGVGLLNYQERLGCVCRRTLIGGAHF